MGGEIMGLAELVQIGINNLLVMYIQGKELTVHELRLLDQFAITTAIELRLKNKWMLKELEKYEDPKYTPREFSSENIDDESDGGDYQST